MNAETRKNLDAEIQEAADKAIDSLARYKFAMFGYWAGIWVHLNRIDGGKRPSPFRDLVHAARAIREEAMTPTQKRQSFLTTSIIKQQKWIEGCEASGKSYTGSNGPAIRAADNDQLVKWEKELRDLKDAA